MAEAGLCVSRVSLIWARLHAGKAITQGDFCVTDGSLSIDRDGNMAVLARKVRFLC